MKNSSKNVKSQENVETVKSQEIEKKSENLKSINLDKFKKELESVELKVKNKKETIYIYPEGWNKEKINSDEGKKFRNRLRNKLNSFSNNIFYFAKCADQEKLMQEIKSFNDYYKTYFRLNDYSIRSLTNSEKREKSIELMIAIVKECMK